MTNEIKIQIKFSPHEAQKKILNISKRFLSIVCGRRFGKTLLAINKLIREAVENPGEFAYIAPTYKQAKRIAWRYLKFFCPKEILAKKPIEIELRLELWNEAGITLYGVDNPDSLRGIGLKGCIVDETADCPENLFMEILRPALADSEGWAWFIGTPKGKVGLFYENFIRDIKYKDDNYRTVENLPVMPDKDFKSFVFKTADNPYIKKTEIEAARRVMSLQTFKQEFEGSFENYAGLIYQEFTDENIIESVQLKAWFNYYISIDTGRYTSIGFWAIDDRDIVYCFDEIYNVDGVVRNIAAEIKNKCIYYKINSIFTVIDSASQVKREYEDRGIFTVDSEKDVLGGIAKVRDRLSSKRLFFCRKARMHIIQNRAWKWDLTKRKPTPVNINDHACDDTIYFLNYPEIRKAENIPEQEKFKKTLLYQIQQENKEQLENSAVWENG